MTRRYNAIAQILAVIGHGVNMSTLVPAQMKTEIALMIALAQSVIAIIAHNYNADGTKAELPYTPAK